MPTLSPPRTADDRLERLLDAAARVFAERGFHATTMRDLARATGMSLAGMYYYVKSKDDLLHLVQQRCFERVLRGAREAIAGVADPAERLRAFIEHHVTFFARHMAEMKVLSREADSLTGAAARTLRARKKTYSALLAALVGGVDPGATSEDRAVTAYVIFGMMNWIYTWYRPSGALAPEALAARIADVALHGIPARAAGRVA
jgi:AcrR family transcriptional regulator